MGYSLTYPFDSGVLLSKYKTIKRELLEETRDFTRKKIAILGGSTTADIRKMLDLFLISYGIIPEFYESEYAKFWEDAMFPSEKLTSFNPDIIYIHTSLRNFAQYEHYEQMWEKLRETYHCPIIQNNFEYPYYRLMGNKEATHGRIKEITEMNLKFSDYARAHDSFYICDINWLSADFGLSKWSDPFYWYMYKYALALPAIPTLSYNVANIIKSIYGTNKKAFALDLDNTLWGGVIGDDGAENIQIGQETPEAMAFSEFQSYLKSHKDLGIILNIISKNERENALAGLKRPDSTLTPDDFISIKANWEPKSLNLSQTAQELSLGVDSFVFVDDNPAEREIVRRQLPGVAIPEITSPEHYIYDIDRAGYFEVTTLTADDAKRNEQYKVNAARSELRNSFSDYNEYLKSLEMSAEIKPFEPLYFSRISQLTNKSNQFNLTTKRYSPDEIEAFSVSEQFITLYGRLNDKFGDNGIVSVIIGEICDNNLKIILWLMSCRVLKRDMEYAMMDELIRIAKTKGIRTLTGYYFPTAKNAMVRDFYETFGFTKISEDTTGATTWSLDTDSYAPKQNSIQVNFIK
ncbi:MAG: HAD-IIIC family phosphatase [Lachnospiraceae bacterium]|nr:HAD-IIIC family phosphatase [Lachnospiraceae bacterium]